MIMKINQVTIYGLSGCEKCENVAKKLRELSIHYEFVECSGYNDTCHDLEVLTACVDYPIVCVGNVLVYQVLNYTKSSARKQLNSHYIGMGVLSIHELVGVVVSEYKHLNYTP